MDSGLDLGALVNAVGDAVIAVDREGTIVLWNPAAERIFGYTADESLGRSLDLIIPENRRGRHWDAFHKVMRTGRTRLNHEVVYATARCKDGRLPRMAFTVGILRAANGEIKAVGAVMREQESR